jgi:hypothetical protein
VISDDQLDELARRIAAYLGAPVRDGGLVDAATVARELGVARSWVYTHSAELGGRRLNGPGRGRPIRFDLEKARAAFAELDELPDAASRPRKRRRRATPQAAHVLGSRPRRAEAA